MGGGEGGPGSAMEWHAYGIQPALGPLVVQHARGVVGGAAHLEFVILIVLLRQLVKGERLQLGVERVTGVLLKARRHGCPFPVCCGVATGVLCLFLGAVAAGRGSVKRV